jgi:hypothetical protein
VASNCEYLNAMVDELTNSYKSAGIYTSPSMWQGIFGTQGCNSVAGKSSLWYAYYNNVQNFNDFKGLGGWTQPTMKQYLGNTRLCEVQLNRNWRP